MTQPHLESLKKRAGAPYRTGTILVGTTETGHDTDLQIPARPDGCRPCSPSLPGSHIGGGRARRQKQQLRQPWQQDLRGSGPDQHGAKHCRTDAALGDRPADGGAAGNPRRRHAAAGSRKTRLFRWSGGGLLGAGLIGMLMGGGFFGGLGGIASILGFLVQIALIGGLIWLAVRFFQRRNQPAMANAGLMARGPINRERGPAGYGRRVGGYGGAGAARRHQRRLRASMASASVPPTMRRSRSCCARSRPPMDMRTRRRSAG